MESNLNEIKMAMFNDILRESRKYFTNDIFQQIKTKKGNTQSVERLYQNTMKTILINMNYTFSEAGSQQPYDFRISIPNMPHEILNLEIKKTDSYLIYFNDTCPTENAYYIILFTGKVTKNVTVHPQIIGVNGYDFIRNCPWVYEYKNELDELKRKYSKMEGNMSVYPRPTFKSDIKFLLNMNVSTPSVEETIIEEIKVDTPPVTEEESDE